MATVFTHAFVGAAIAHVAPLSVSKRRLLICASLLAVVPDADVAGFRLGVSYGHPLGHRGITHSLFFALLAGVLAARFVFPAVSLRAREGWRLVATLALATASHGVIDAFTDAGLGVGFLLPFESTRSFAPWRPLATSPLGIRSFFTERAFGILANEAVWVVLPVCGLLWLRARLRSWYAG